MKIRKTRQTVQTVQFGKTTFTFQVEAAPRAVDRTEMIRSVLLGLTKPNILVITLPAGTPRQRVAPLIRSLRTTRRPFSYAWTSPTTLQITPTTP
jgi:hypothetical protein